MVLIIPEGDKRLNLIARILKHWQRVLGCSSALEGKEV